jgi:hypothetical protein
MPEISNFSDLAAKVGQAVGFAANPIQSTAMMVGSEIIANRNASERNEEQMSYTDPFSSGFGSFNPQQQANMNATRGGFFGNLGQTIGDFGSDVGNFVQDIAPALNLFGIGNQPQRTNAGTAATIIKQAPDEQASSGEILGANLGMGGALVSAGRNLFRSPGGQTALGFGAGAVGAAMMPSGNGAPRITRKMKSDVRRIYMMAGMDPAITAQILNNMGTYPKMNFNASLVFFILTKRFRNDGPVVTKAAVRKTKSTLRRMKGVVDMYNSVCKPTAPRRRAAPSRAKAVQLISNK